MTALGLCPTAPGWGLPHHLRIFHTPLACTVPGQCTVPIAALTPRNPPEGRGLPSRHSTQTSCGAGRAGSRALEVERVCSS